MTTKKKRKSVKVADLVRTAPEAPATEKRTEPSTPPRNPYAFVSHRSWRHRALGLAQSIWLRIDASLKSRFPLMREMLYQRVKPLRRFA